MKICVYLLLLIPVIQSAKILIAVPSPSLSHNLFYRPIIKGLLAKGHSITSITTDPINDATLTNLTEIDFHEESYRIMPLGKFFQARQVEKARLMNFFRLGKSLMVELLDKFYQHPDVQNLLKTRPKFDVILAENFYYAPLYALKKHLQAPIITIMSADLSLNIYDAVGNPTFPSYFVDYQKVSGLNLNFRQRLENFLFALEFRWFYYLELMPLFEEVVEKHFGQKYDLAYAENTVDLVIVNSNPVFHDAKPLVPTIIQIGGLHWKELKGLDPVSI